MSPAVQMFVCPRCRRGEFRSLPGANGKAYCPWCGDAVGEAVVPAEPPPPAPPPAAVPVPEVAESAARVLQDRVEELSRRCEEAEAALRREQEKKQEIKKAVMEEMERLGGQLEATKAFLLQKEQDHRDALAEAGRLKEDLGKARGELASKDLAARAIEAELEERRKAVRVLQDTQDVARRDAEELRAHYEKARRSYDADLAELRRRLSTEEAEIRKRVAAEEAALRKRLAAEEAERKALQARLQDEQRRSEKERAELRARTSTLQADLEKRDQRIRELQMLVKTLGERLNELTRRHFG